jgi:CheY-like chemotaxis protein/HPt (histidine-containing phosphotransfer) domain-containing protein
MRFFSEISLLLLLTVCPLLTLGGLSLRFTIPGEWFLLAGVMSVMFALTTIARVRHRFVQPLKTLTENLYANIETPGRHQPPELRQLLRAIRFYSAAGNVDAMNRVNELELVIRDDISAHNAGDRLLKQEREVLRETKSEIIDATKDLEVQKLLARETARKVIALANSNPLDPEAVTELENLQFLLTDSHLFPATKNHDLLMLIDRVIDITAPLSRMRNATFQVEFESDCPLHFSLDNRRFGSSLFQLIIGYLQLSDQPQDKQEQVFIKIGQTTKGFTLTFPKASNLKPNTGLDESLKSAGATWNHKTLTFPATVIHQKISAETDLTAIVVAEDEHERSSLTKRLSFLGINCITDFKNQHLDICVVSDETSEVFLSIKPYLPEATFVLMLNNRQHYQHPRWITVNDPVTQTQLEKIVARITSTKDISSEKNVLVVDDSEVNIQLLEIQLKELGHNVTTAGTGEVAVSLATRGRFEMIFMDIQMPGIGGLEATNRIRQHNRSVPIVGLTAHATTEEKKGCLEAGMNDVLIKPVRMESLRVMTQRLGQPDAFPPLAASGTTALPAFDLDLALENAGDRRDLATELFDLLLASLPSDLDAINAASSNINELKRAVHKLHGAVRYCGVPRLAKAIEKLELALKQGNELEIQPLLNLLNGEVTALNTWHHDNPDVLSSGDQQIKHR